MNKKWSFLLGSVLVLLCGCYIFSLKPYYTEKNKIAVPKEAAGFWRDADNNVIEFKPDGQAAYFSNAPEDPAKLVYQVVFFKVDKNLYIDGELQINESKLKLGMAEFAVMPLHLLYKVEFSGEKLKLWVPDWEKINKILSVEHNLSFVSYQKTPSELSNHEAVIFNADGEAWEGVLRKYDIWSEEPIEYNKFDPAVFNAAQAAKQPKK